MYYGGDYMKIWNRHGGGMEIPNWLVFIGLGTAETITKYVCAAKTGNKPEPAISISITKPVEQTDKQ